MPCSHRVHVCDGMPCHCSVCLDIRVHLAQTVTHSMIPIHSYLFHPYSKHMGPGINVVWLLLMVVGLGSIYFHATLSFAGQMIDELAIVWVLLAAFAIWTPKHLLNWPFNGNRCVCVCWGVCVCVFACM